jgi:hypothetical protein
MWMWLVWTGLTAAGAVAQDYPPPAPPQRPSKANAAGLLLTDRMIDSAINRITDQMAEIYGFDEDQLWNTRDTIKARFPEWLKQNRAELQGLVVQYLEAVMGDEPPSPEEVADWATRAAPLFGEFNSLVGETADDMRGYLTDQQQVLLDGQLAAMQVGMNYMQQRLGNWSQGGYDWKTEWPRSKGFQDEEKGRQQKLEQEAQQAKNVAMGLPPDAGDAAAAGGAVADAPKPPTPTRPSNSAAKDEWAVYVDNFIKRYELDDAQQNSAKKFLRDAQELRDRYLARHVDDIKALEAKQKVAQGDEDKERLRGQFVELNRPIDRYFQRLKDRLEGLPTRKQRALAAQTDEAGRGKAAVAEEVKANARSAPSAGAETRQATNGGGKE